MVRSLKVWCFLALTALPALATPIFVVNAGFEDPDLADGTNITGRQSNCLSNPAPYNVPGCTGFGSGWTTADEFGDSNGVMDPTVGIGVGTDPTLFPMFPFIPEGENVAYSNGTAFFQILPEIITANTTYTFSFWAGSRQDVGVNPFYENQGYYGELAADVNGSYFSRSVLARTVNKPNAGFTFSVNAPDAPTPAYGEWLLVTLSYTVLAGDPNIGRNLMISLSSPAVQASFDAVSVDATSTNVVPEPASFALLGAGLAGMMLRRRLSR